MPIKNDELITSLAAEAAANGFDGETYDPPKDEIRLTGQLLRVWQVMSDHRPRSLRELALAAGGSEGGVAARLRDLRKERFGSHQVKATRIQGGLYYYEVLA